MQAFFSNYQVASSIIVALVQSPSLRGTLIRDAGPVLLDFSLSVLRRMAKNASMDVVIVLKGVHQNRFGTSGHRLLFHTVERCFFLIEKCESYHVRPISLGPKSNRVP